MKLPQQTIIGFVTAAVLGTAAQAKDIIHAAEPRAYVEGRPKVARLFPDYRKTLEALFRYSHEQGFSERELKIEDLFDSRGLELREV